MITSIRKFLLVNMLLAILITTTITVVGNYYLDQKDIEHHLDALLSQAAFTFEALVGKDINKNDLEKLQNELSAIPNRTEKSFLQDFGNYTTYLYEKYQFQMWDKEGHLLLRSRHAPLVPIANLKEGFSYKDLNGQIWRSFATTNPATGATIIVGEQYDDRNLLAREITMDDIYIMLLTFPIAGLLIWFIIGQGLRSIERVTDEVSHRLPNYLEPVNAENVPSEIEPLMVELNKLFLRLQQAIEREKRFAADAAHELRTPLAALKTQAQVALKTTNEKERQIILHNVILGVDRCTHVVQQLLTLSRLVPESNTLSDVIKLNIARLAGEIVAQLAPSALDKQIDIELIAEDEENSMIVGNITALSILIRNLVDNAIRYTPENGAVQIIVKSENDIVILRVTDNGPGIPAELRARVFERFFRVLGSKSPGSGLGLAIVQQIAQLHQAQVKLGPPSTGKGLEVEIIFPKDMQTP